MTGTAVASAPADSLRLVTPKNISHHGRCHVGRFIGARLTDSLTFQGVKANLRCKSWACDVCRPMLVRSLRKRIFRGEMTAEANDLGGETAYGVKLLTLTLPGAAWRAEHSPDLAYELASDAWDKLVRDLKKVFGKFSYLRVVEKQRDGYPHFHVLLVGRAIAPKGILDTIRDLWSRKYFGAWANVDIRPVKNWKHSVRYITKYLLKSEGCFGEKGKKYTASKGALMKKKKAEWLRSRVYMGSVQGEGDHVEIIEREIDWGLDPRIVERELEALVNEVFGDGRHPFIKRG